MSAPKVIVFLGPTLSHEAAQRELDAIYVGPAAQGDVYRAVREKPFAIGLVDGYFERLPSVWHKEVLWALSRGVHVFGSSSMGALRAAELAAFGMIGVGEIYQSFADGSLEDDDEVAVAHSDAENGFRAASEAMVNIRATLASAEQARVISVSTRERLVHLGKSTFYPDRSYASLFSRALAAGLPVDEVEAARAFVLTRRVDQKRQDAIALLRALSDCVAVGEPPAKAAFPFAHTDAWEHAMQWAKTQPPLCGDTASNLIHPDRTEQGEGI